MTVALTVPPEGWTHAELDRLPEEIAYLTEVVDGNLIVAPAPSAWHNDVIAELRNALVAAADHGLWAYADTEIRHVDPDGFIRQRPIPDLLVAPRALRDLRSFAVPDEVALVVEVVSPTSARRDRLEKPALYARLGIPAMWRVERGITVVEYRLDPSGRVEMIQTVSGGRFSTNHPFPIDIDLDEV